MYCNKYTFYMIELIFIILQNCDYTNAYIKLEKEGDFNSLSEIFNHILNLKKGRASSNHEFQLYDPYSTKLKNLVEDRSDENLDQIAVVIFDNDNSKSNLENMNGILSLKDKYQYDGTNLKRIMELARKEDVETGDSKENNIINLERSDEHDQLAEDYTSSELVSTNKDIQPGEVRMQSNLKRFGTVCRKSTKRCIKACRDTYKSVCRYYICSKKMKSMFKRKCKRNCKDRMINN